MASVVIRVGRRIRNFGRGLQTRVALEIVMRSVFHLRGSFSSHAEAIAAGGYDFLYGIAEDPSVIQGAAIQPVDCDARPNHPGVELTTKQAYERYFAADNAADLCDLLMLGFQHSTVQRHFPVAVIWKVGEVFWYAILGEDGGLRYLNVGRGGAPAIFNGNYRFLTRKSRKSRA